MRRTSVVPLLKHHRGWGMRSVGFSFCILVARAVLILGFASLADSAVGVAAVAAVPAAIIWIF
jgi:hypothetical protein